MKKLSPKKKDEKSDNVESNSFILRAHLTEKSSNSSNNNVYTFVVTDDTNKTELEKEIQKNYKVNPIKINIINLPKRKVLVRGRIGEKKGKKKALVFLKKGDTINLV